MTNEAKIERVARALCAAEGIDPDTLIHPGKPLMLRDDVGYAARSHVDARPYWTFKQREAQAAIDAMPKGDHELSAAYVRLRGMIPGAFDTPYAPTPEQIWDVTEKALARLVRQAHA